MEQIGDFPREPPAPMEFRRHGRSVLSSQERCYIPQQLKHVKPDGIDGSQVSRYVAEGRINEVASYCESDVVSTFRVWLVYELFKGALSREEFLASEANLREFLLERSMVKPHLRHLLGEEAIAVAPTAAPAIYPGIDLSVVVVAGQSDGTDFGPE